MKRFFLGIIAYIFSSFGCIAHEQNMNYAFIGHWIFSKHETIESFKNSAMTEAEVKEFSSILKPAEIIITENIYSGFIRGRVPTHTPYSIISVSDSGQCYKLQLEDPRIPLNIQTHEVCVINDKLLLPSVKGSKEVFNRKR
ncbi:hypothetical protein EXT48_21935 [Pseudoalteromonas sp. CO348]|uniref:hypothetical protein n=1 Tax=Pseudoalteromonas TaxID=53246 RepID=UPI001022C2AE|nr:MULTISPECIES: hypothetical protein [Pseudoalteromonas]MCG7540180.1 hypothetical protein [Pseudoalteromonas sp. OF7H-1]QZO15136.1 hypothetical protein K5642_23025 [Pseudoalteromonas piscicida]RZF98712.1 hypothetical protein EXT48_21935 [Pseudoalteromonas sp. CO348]